MQRASWEGEQDREHVPLEHTLCFFSEEYGMIKRMEKYLAEESL